MARYRLQVSEETRRIVEERDKGCVVCGFSAYLELHHIDPYQPQDRVNDPSNLCMLCRDCHECMTYLQRRHPSIYYRVVVPYLRRRIGVEAA